MVLLMKENHRKLLKEKAQGASMNKEIRKKILDNKDDLIEGTFCYSLFEDSFFDEEQLILLIKDAEAFFKANDSDPEVEYVLLWMVPCVDQCFKSHHDNSDYYKIKNYKKSFEDEWVSNWKGRILKIVNGK